MFLRSFVFSSLFVFSASARTLDINNESLAAYIVATGGGSALATSALDGEAGSAVRYEPGVNYNYTGEFGFIYSRPRFSLRFGFEIIRPWVLDSSATESGVELYKVKSDILGYAPKVAAELNLQSSARSRSFISVGVGAVSVRMKNTYEMTTDGQSSFPGVTDHVVEAKGATSLMSAALGYEGAIFDTNTMVIEFGYRQLTINNLSYSKDVTTFSGAEQTGDSVLTSTGAPREMNMSGGFIALGFRFYL